MQVLVSVEVCFVRTPVGALLAHETSHMTVVFHVLDQMGFLGCREGTQVALEGPDVDVCHNVTFEVPPVLGLVVAVPTHVGFLVGSVIYHVEDEGIERGGSHHALLAVQSVVSADNVRLGGGPRFLLFALRTLFTDLTALWRWRVVVFSMTSCCVHLEECLQHCGSSGAL